jgi:hypothetical protein
MLEETTPRTSAAWRPHETFAHEMGMDKPGAAPLEKSGTEPTHGEVEVKEMVP